MLYVMPGKRIVVNFKWTNTGVVAFAPVFQLGIKSGGTWDQWLYGPALDLSVVTGGLLGPNETSGTHGIGVTVPDNWSPGSIIDVEIRSKLDGYYDWARVDGWDDVVQIPDIEADWITIVDPEIVIPGS